MIFNKKVDKNVFLCYLADIANNKEVLTMAEVNLTTEETDALLEVVDKVKV